jgi:AraC-like DNA-binding protein
MRPQPVQCGLCLHGAKGFEVHCQKECWSLHFYNYSGTLKIAGKTLVFHSGSVSLIPPGAEVQWQFPPHASHYYAHFKTRSHSRGGCVDISVLSPVDAIPDGVGGQFDDLVRFFAAGEMLRASIRLWDLLFQIAEPQGSPVFSHIPHPALQVALALIRNNPGKNLRVQHLAAQTGVSRSQLTRLFQREFRCGVKEYIQRANIARATGLLRRSAMTIKSIAMTCGFNDLSHFNKTIRRETGTSPTRYRLQTPRVDGL